MPQPPVITGFKLNARFPSGGVPSRGATLSHHCWDTGEGAVDAAPGLQALPMCLSFVECGQCPFAVINRSHEDNHMLRS